MLTAYYDLSVSPATYDIVAFLSHAELTRTRLGDRKVRVVILPGPRAGFRDDRFWPFDIAERVRMRDRVAIPMARMLPSAEVVSCEARPRRPVSTEAIGWQQRLYGFRVHLAALNAGVRPLRPRKEEAAGLGRGPARNLVTITLRECEHWPERNSNLGAWHEAAALIRSMGYTVMIVRDTRQAGARFGEFASAHEPALDLEARARLYRSSALNLFVNNGPAWLAVALDAPVMIFKLVIEGLMPTVSARYFTSCGLPPGHQLPAPHQHIVWSDDTFETISAAFTRWHEARERGGDRPDLAQIQRRMIAGWQPEAAS
jgi:hypothetical protein